MCTFHKKILVQHIRSLLFGNSCRRRICFDMTNKTHRINSKQMIKVIVATKSSITTYLYFEIKEQLEHNNEAQASLYCLEYAFACH